MQNIQNRYWVSQSWVPGAGARPDAAGSTGQSRTGLSSRREPDSAMHGSGSGSGSQAGQGAVSSSEGGHGQRERDPRDPPALS